MDQRGELGSVFAVRMTRQIEAQARLLVGQALAVDPLPGFDQLRSSRRVLVGVIAKERDLRGGSLGFFGELQRGTNRREQARPPLVDRVERAGTDQRLDRAPVDGALVDAAAELEQIDKRSGLARLDDRLDRRLPGPLDAAEAIANVLFVDRCETV